MQTTGSTAVCENKHMSNTKITKGNKSFSPPVRWKVTRAVTCPNNKFKKTSTELSREIWNLILYCSLIFNIWIWEKVTVSPDDVGLEMTKLRFKEGLKVILFGFKIRSKA